MTDRWHHVAHADQYDTVPRSMNYPGPGFYPRFYGGTGVRTLRQSGLGSVSLPQPLIYGAIGLAVFSIVWYLWPERKVRMV